MLFNICGIDFSLEIRNRRVKSEIADKYKHLIVDHEDGKWPSRGLEGSGYDKVSFFQAYDYITKFRSFILQRENYELVFHAHLGFLDFLRVNDQFSDIIEGFINRYAYYRVVNDKGFFVHASAVKLFGRGLIFAGDSGSGKTTIRSLLASGQKLTEEVVAIKKDKKTKNSFKVYSFPWGLDKNEFQIKESRADALFFLCRDGTNHIEKKEKKCAYSSLLKNLYLMPPDTELKLDLYEMAMLFCKDVDSYDIYFTPDANPQDMIKNVLEGEGSVSKKRICFCQA